MRHDEILLALKELANFAPEHLQSSIVKLQQFIGSQKNYAAPQIQKNEIDSLIELLLSDKWPAAVAPTAICNASDEEDKMIRAEGIIDYVLQTSVDNKKFLDFGTGSGHVPRFAASKNCKISVGYDIIQPQASAVPWESKQEKLLLTTNFNLVKENAPYDIILLYDVLDHVEEGTVVDVLKKAANLLSPTGYLQTRVHPWCSRHGGHYYHILNKAFVHLVFTTEELESRGYLSAEPITYKVIHPLASYENWFKAAGFKKVNRKKDNDLKLQVEAFFYQNKIIRDRITRNWKNSSDKKAKKWPDFQMSMQNIDYILTHEN